MDWEQFTKTLEGIVENRIKPLEEQVTYQKELISKLSTSLQEMQVSLNAKGGKKFQVKPAVNSPRAVMRECKSPRSQLSEADEENPGEATKDDSEEHKEC